MMEEVIGPSYSLRGVRALSKFLRNWQASPGEFGAFLRKKRIPHLSFSSISTLEFCEYRYYLEYVLRRKLKETPLYFTKGKLFHRVAADFYQRTNDRECPSFR